MAEGDGGRGVLLGDGLLCFLEGRSLGLTVRWGELKHPKGISTRGPWTVCFFDGGSGASGGVRGPWTVFFDEVVWAAIRARPSVVAPPVVSGG